MSSPDIRYIKNKDIDYQKWDRCVDRSTLPLLYARSWYLDLVSPGWDALVGNDYDCVMPLIVKQKLGFSFLLQPVYAQQLGIFPEPDWLVQNAFLTTVADQFNYIAIHINASHREPFPGEFRVTTRDNYILDLSPSLTELKHNYSKHTRRQIRKAEDNKVLIVKGLPPADYLDLKMSCAGAHPALVRGTSLKRLIEYGHLHGNGVIYAAYNETNRLCAAAFIVISGQRVTYLNAVSNEEGKNTNAMHLIVDQLIKEHSGSGFTLDFEGSVIPGIARFYKGFGAQTEHYYCLKSNRLPLPLRWFKK